MEKGKVHFYSGASNGETKSSMTIYENGDIQFKVEESQLDEIEKKVDKILELLEEKDSSTSLEIDKKLDNFIKCNHERVLRSNRQDYGI